MFKESMRNILFKMSYVGTNYSGFAPQINSVSIYNVLKYNLDTVLGEEIIINGCSRTDSKVHANEYYFNVNTKSSIPCGKLPLILNSRLPKDIVIFSCKDVEDDFHARFSVKYKEYIYKIWNDRIMNPFLVDLAYQYPYDFHPDLIREASKFFIGKHDFKAFSNTGNFIENTMRTIKSISVRTEDKLITISVKGDGFLYKMVRIIIGTLLDVNRGRLIPSDISAIIESKDRTNAGKTAPACGLYLNRVYY